MTTTEILRVARIYAAHRRIALSTVGRLGMGHGHFFDRLADGRVTIRRAERALQWLSDHWPADLVWPSDIPRPAPSVEVESGEAA